MLKKVKKSFILFMCTIVLVTSISITVYKPIPVKAAAIAAAPIAESAITFILELIAAGLVSVGAYELYENKDYFAEVVNEYMSAINDWPSNWGQVEEKHHGQIWVKDPNDFGAWTGITGDTTIVLNPDEQEYYGWDSPFVYPDQHAAFLKKVYDKGNGNGGGGGGGNDNEPNNNNKFDLNNLDVDFLAKSSAGVATSISIFLEKLFSGEVDNPILAEALNLTGEQTSYYGELDRSPSGDIFVNMAGTYSYSFDYKVSSFEASFISFDSVRACIYKTYDSNYGYSSYSYRTYNGSIFDEPKIYKTVTKFDSSGSITGINNEYGYVGYVDRGSLSANVPIFNDAQSASNYLNTGDDTGCINKKEKPLFTALDYKAMSSKLPSTLGALSSLPSGKAFNATALKDYVNDMVANKDNITDVETQTNTAKEKLEEHIEQNKTDIKTDTDTEPKPSPLPVPKPDFPTPDDITIEDIDVTRDWRLVFPFCIPFDIIDLFRVLEAEPEAPYFEIPFVYEEIGLDYTFVIDFEQFNSLAEILRLGEVVFFILGLCMLTGKVIKW